MFLAQSTIRNRTIAKVLELSNPRPDISDSAADFLDEPIVVAIAEGTCVTPKKCQRKEP